MENAAAEAVLCSYPERFRARRIALPPQGQGFSRAIVLQVETDAGLFCLRAWPAGNTDALRIRGLHGLLAHLRSCGVDFVAVPVSARDGNTLISYAGRWWQLEPWLPGQADFETQPSDVRLTSAMTALAQWHRAAARFDPSGPGGDWFQSSAMAIAPSVTDRRKRIAGWTSEKRSQVRTSLAKLPESENRFAAVSEKILEHYERSAPQIAHELELAENLRVSLQPCLRDVWHDHVLFQGDAVTGIIDPSAAKSDTVAADLSRLLGSLLGEDLKRWTTALDAYHDVRAISSEERMLVEVLDRSAVLLSGMTWLSRRLLEGEPFSQPQRVIARLEKIATRLEALHHSIL